MRRQTVFDSRLIDGEDHRPYLVRFFEGGEGRHLWAEVNG